MADYKDQYQTSVQGRAGVREGIDEGLRAYMLGVYNNMALGLAFTGLAALVTNYLAVGADGSLTQLGAAIYTSPLRWVVMFAPLLFVFGFAAGIHKMAPATARIVFFAFAGVMGIFSASEGNEVVFGDVAPRLA